MLKFIYVADTHWGADPMGYQQQRGYPDRLKEILAAVCRFAEQEGDVAFMLHGGDMIDSTTEDNIRSASDLFSLPFPVHLCLGNHDLTEPDAVERWLAIAPDFFIDDSPDFVITTDYCRIHVAPNHWCDKPYFWHDEQSPALSQNQLERLRGALNEAPDLPHILVTHCSVHGLPPGQTGFAEALHAPVSSFTTAIGALGARRPSLRCVLGAHSHMNMRVERDGVQYASVSALVETPFELKLFRISAAQMQMSTISLQPFLDFTGDYDGSRTYVQGREEDRSFTVSLPVQSDRT